MAVVEPPKHWQDWASWALGFWLILSPWILMFWTQGKALDNAIAVGVLLLLVEAVTLSAFRLWEEGANVLLGLWLIVSPFVLGMSGAVATTDFIVVGLLVLFLAVAELREIMTGQGGEA